MIPKFIISVIHNSQDLIIRKILYSYGSQFQGAFLPMLVISKVYNDKSGDEIGFFLPKKGEFFYFTIANLVQSILNPILFSEFE